MREPDEDSLTFLDRSLTSWVLVTQVYWMADRLYERRLAELHVTVQQARVLTALRQAGRPLRPSEIAEVLFREVQSIAPLLQRVQACGWIARIPHPDVERAVAMDLTDAGRELAASVEAISVSLYKTLFEPAMNGHASDTLDGLRAVRDRGFELPETDFRLRRARRWPIWRL